MKMKFMQKGAETEKRKQLEKEAKDAKQASQWGDDSSVQVYAFSPFHPPLHC